jgi:predicted transglutaminase-like cysteine proteinase
MIQKSSAMLSINLILINLSILFRLLSRTLLVLTAGLLPYIATAIDLNLLLTTYSRYAKGNPQIFHEWKKLIVESGELPVSDKLQRVNEFFNRRIAFGEDRQIWGQSDYWATPMETLARSAGDCEDFTIAKYFTLLNLKIPVERLRLVYVKARIGGTASSIQQAHMVLTYYETPDAEPLVLDNLISEIRPAGRRPDLQPVFSFNSQGVFVGMAANSAAGPNGVGQLSRWQDLLRRALAEGFE